MHVVVADHESYLVASLSSFPSYLQENFRCTARVIHIHDPPDELEEKGEGGPSAFEPLSSNAGPSANSKPGR